MRNFTLALCYLPAVVWSQEMLLSSGSMTIAPGTRIAFDAPLSWTIDAGSSVVNDGLVDLGEGQLIEALGAPITGDGFETAFSLLPGGTFATEPGGLGLHFSGEATAGTLTITRGHQPIVVNGTISSVARWFEVQPTATASTVIGTALRIDPTELNGIEAALLQHHHAQSVQGPWVPVTGSVDLGTLTVAAEMDLADRFVTAFAADVMTSVPGRDADAFRLWPTVSDDLVHFEHARLDARSVVVVAADGSIVPVPVLRRDARSGSFDVSGLASGVYVVRPDQGPSQRFIRP
ncbi:MAG: hypothetical protein R2817_08460 [Flavobacteriales bacterium]